MELTTKYLKIEGKTFRADRRIPGPQREKVDPKPTEAVKEIKAMPSGKNTGGES